MADVVTKTRTNCFSTTDPVKLKNLLSAVKTDGGNIVTCSLDGKFMFYCHGDIEGILTDEAKEKMADDPDWADDHPDEAWSLDAFLEELSGLVAPGDACIIKLVGYESMRCIFAGARIVAHKKQSGYEDLDRILIRKARSLLADPSWDTRMGG